jgi:hypothetical protein
VRRASLKVPAKRRPCLAGNARETVIGCGHGKRRNIAGLQTALLKLAKHKTGQPSTPGFPSALPEIRKGIRIKAS